MTTDEKLRALCSALLAAQTDEGVIRLLPQLHEALRKHEQELDGLDIADEEVA